MTTFVVDIASIAIAVGVFVLAIVALCWLILIGPHRSPWRR